MFPPAKNCGRPSITDPHEVIAEWNAFRALDFVRVKELAAAPVLVDLRNIYSPEDMVAAGFTYASIGRASGIFAALRAKPIKWAP